MKALNFVLVFVFAFVLSAPVFSQSFEKREASETSAKFSRSGDKGYLDDGATVVQVKRVSFPPPDFPRRALRLGVEGTVRLEFDIAPDGSVLDPYVVESNPPGVFDRNALEELYMNLPFITVHLARSIMFKLISLLNSINFFFKISRGTRAN